MCELFIIFIDDCEFWKNKIDMLDMFNFFNEIEIYDG